MPADAVQERLFADADPSVYTVRTESFEGPLDLLLFLIRKNEVDIYNIPIAAITRQYLDYVELLKELNLDIAGEFLVMASTLVQIKSRMLLPAPEVEEAEEAEEDPRAELVRRLLEYQRYREAANSLAECALLGREVFARKFIPAELGELKPVEAPPEVELFELIEAFRGLLAKVPPATFHEVGAEGMTIADRINEVLDLLRGKEALTFERLFIAPLTREYLVVTFLAILELCKLRMVKLLQANSFGVIWIAPRLLEGDAAEGGSP
ncbi:MAG: segregation/condensation protein A [Geobacteraceae bacterium]|nr:segregation/condensation protein A [Geobacteraceae bacterium]